jgi:phage-related protein
MTINGISITTFNATLLQYDIEPASATVFTDWLRKGFNPIISGKTVQFKQLNLSFLIRDITRAACLADISNILVALQQATLFFDDLPYYYDCTINGVPKITPSNDRKFQVAVTLQSSYAYLATQTVTLAGTSQTIYNEGNLPTPAIVNITPSTNLSSVILTGLSIDSITVNNLQANTSIVIDGEQCLVTQNGTNKYMDTNMWEFPSLQPGANLISINHSGVSVQIQYKPKFM